MKLGKLTGEEISHDELEKLQLSPERYARQRRQEAIALDNQDQGKAFSIALWRWLRSFLDSDENTWQIPDSPSLAKPPDPGRPAAGPWSVASACAASCCSATRRPAAGRSSPRR
jgi:hypothetical protein